jgi:hypothetical protein
MVLKEQFLRFLLVPRLNFSGSVSYLTLSSAPLHGSCGRRLSASLFLLPAKNN